MNQDKPEESLENKKTYRILLFEKYPDIGIITTAALVLGYWYGLPPDQRMLKNTLVEISTLLPFFILVVTIAFEIVGGILMSVLAYGLRKWEEAITMRKNRIEKEKQLIAKLVSKRISEGIAKAKEEGKTLEEVLEVERNKKGDSSNTKAA